MSVRLKALGAELRRGLAQILFPNSCLACGQFMPERDARFCADCESAILTDSHPSCPRCAGSVGPYLPLSDGCSHCRDQRFHFDRAIRLGCYDGILRDLILRLKHASGEMLAEILGELWASRVRAAMGDIGPTVVVPVPLHWRRRWARGYNQSETLAQTLAEGLGVPCRPSCIRRVRNTPRQVGQSAAIRRQNVRNAFKARASPELKGRTVLLVDDVLTTGSTASEAARALRGAGAEKIVVAVLAHSRG